MKTSDAYVDVVTTPDYTMPNQCVVRDASIIAASGGWRVLMTFGHEAADDEERLWLDWRGNPVLWIPYLAKERQMRLMVCVHIQEAGYWGGRRYSPEAEQVLRVEDDGGCLGCFAGVFVLCGLSDARAGAPVVE